MQNALASPVLSEALTYLTNGKVALHNVENPSTTRTSAPLFSSPVSRQIQGSRAAFERRVFEIRNRAGLVAT